MRNRILLLILMTGYDASLHLARYFGIEAIHPTYGWFTDVGIITYTEFWSLYWLVAFIIAVSLYITLIKKEE